ncbi:MAG: TlpA disulfide reductase family protein [Chitinophagaceae bacterium]
MNKIRIAIAILAVFLGAQATAQPGSASLQLRIGNAKADDTLRLSVWDHVLSARVFSQLNARTFVAPNKNGVFTFRIDSIEGPVYFSVMKDRLRSEGSYASMLSQQLMEPGDQVSVSMDSLVPVFVRYGELGDQLVGYRKVNIRFTGKGAAKYEFEEKIERETEDWIVKRRSGDWGTHPKYDSAYFTTLPVVMEGHNKFAADKYAFQQQLLQPYKSKMSAQAWQIMRANLAGEMESVMTGGFVTYRGMFRRDTTVSTDFKTALTGRLQQVYDTRKRPDISDVSKDLLPYSVNYVGFVSDQAYYIRKDQYASIKKDYEPGIFRDKVITDFVLKWMFHVKNVNDALADAASSVDDPYYAAIVGNIFNRQSIGSEGFNFELPDTKGKLVRLSDFKGKIVFIDLWYTGCGACAGFYKYQLSRVEKHYEDNPDVVFITISIDGTLDRWLQSVNEGTYSSPNSPNVVNLYTNGQGPNHPLIKAYNVMGYPHPFMIDRNGKIYQIDSLQTSAENLIPIIDKALAKKS